MNGGSELVSWVVSGGYPICSFRQFLARMCRFATIQNVTDGQTDDDRRHWIPKAPVRSAKNVTSSRAPELTRRLPYYRNGRPKTTNFDVGNYAWVSIVGLYRFLK